jgi:hypothetical protein
METTHRITPGFLLATACLLALYILLATSCRRDDDLFTAYKIERGSHECIGWRGEIADADQHIEFSFSGGCVYSDSLCPGWNKLWGYSDGFDGIHENSNRIAWRSTGSGIALAGYFYVRGQRIILPIDTVSPWHVNTGRIYWQRGAYIVEINGNYCIASQPVEPKGVLFQCYPYFGGPEPAPQNMTIYIKQYEQ